MGFDYHQNLTIGSVLTPPDPAASGTTLEVSVDDAAIFPDPAVDGEYNATIWPANEMPQLSNAEIVRITAKDENEFTITREQEDTSARTILVGDKIAITITKKTARDIEEAVGGISASYTPGSGETATLILSEKIREHRVQAPAGNISIDFSGGRDGLKFVVRFKQDGTGERTITWTDNANITWLTTDGNAPAPASGANKITIYGFVQTGASTWDGLLVGNN